MKLIEGIEWDPEKNKWNIKRGRPSFEEAVPVLHGAVMLKEDKRFDYGEDRFIAYGLKNDRLMVVVFTIRGKNIRIISYRKANNREIEEYERREKTRIFD